MEDTSMPSPCQSMLWELVTEEEWELPHHNRHLRDAEESPEKQALKRTAQETNDVVSSLLKHLHTKSHASSSTKFSSKSMRFLKSNNCPAFEFPATIKVVNEDTLNVAVNLVSSAAALPVCRGHPNPRPMIINFASHRKPGGGWLNGAMAQEESICYRSSLALSLHASHYPLALDELIYSPYVLVMRSDLKSGHNLLSPRKAPEDLPVVSAVTVAALFRPALRTAGVENFQKWQRGHNTRSHYTVDRSTSSPPDSPWPTDQVFGRERDRDLTKIKMKFALRIAAMNNHVTLVLGAMGCGVYGNPPNEIAKCWLEVLQDKEFYGNWWHEVYFAVYDPMSNGNFATFKQVLDGQKV
ncbi:hypothetical protein N7466_003546 [Penicillium verhagenii]|uniref:uncharacterized protein n=1 Tax=Penicillium verhagenii TaxID=1562060 RepID=UPI002544E4A2|nr:uncharacterized protein N7466_003546 [Penicillium verhagenii]KAJ5937096.1 hypothetical protein N7466_003546 [Penicillium verhagenii]